jgi:anti-anti-sigma regulatory factor
VIDLTVAARFVRRRRAARSAEDPATLDALSSEDFAWLAGATGVELSVRTRGRAHEVSVAGEFDSASVDVVDDVLGQLFRRLPARVELDLRRASFVDRSAEEMITRARARARSDDVRFLVIRPQPSLVRHLGCGCDGGQRSRRR